MDRNTLIGISLIFLLFYVWAKLNAPSEEELEKSRRLKEIAAQQVEGGTDQASIDSVADEVIALDTVLSDSLALRQLRNDYGIFAPATRGSNEVVVLENDKLRLEFNTKGGSIRKAQVMEYKKLAETEEHEDIFSDLILLEDDKNKFEYHLPVSGVAGGYIKTSELYFSPSTSGNTLTLTARLEGGRSIQQIYHLRENGYGIDYELVLKGLDKVVDANEQSITLHWINYLDKIEKNTTYERIYSSVYFKEVGEDPSYCSQSRDDEEVLDDNPVKWISHSNQFFNSTLIAEEQFESAIVSSKMIDEEQEDLKLLSSEIKIPLTGSSDESVEMHWYIGPNEFDLLRDYGYDMEDIVPFGWSIFGSINRWIIRPIFSFLSGFIGSKGIVILLLTLIVKSLVYPLTYRMLYSQSKMSALKPKMAKIKDKYKEDQQKQQMENMKIYREYGVNPAGGCFPMILQMPIWFALYRFFPASIEFRQASFLWADDLSSYDVFFRLPFDIPFFGDHLSLFTLLWAVSMVGYTYYNSKIMDMSSMNAMPAMKYMQYAMPLMFVLFFNSYASGLTCYLLFSNLLNIGQTLVTKNYLIDNEKIQAELDAAKKKPKKKGGFQERLQKALQEQQRLAEERNRKK